MNFTYFKGPVDDMCDLLAGRHKCSICNYDHDYCFDLAFTIGGKFEAGEREGKVGCYNCLRDGEFEFWHDTEFGMLDEKGLSKVYPHNLDNPPQIDLSILTELRRTPQVVTYQQGVWLIHCNDFMVYTGIWNPLDFYKNSPSGDGRDLFMQMTDKEINHLWDASLPGGETLLEQWYPSYYVFECRHCLKLRGYWDCD